MAGEVAPRVSPALRFGLELARYRKERGLSQRRLAEHLGCSPSLVGHVEIGSRNAQLDFAEACDRYFDLPEKDYFVRLCRRIHQYPAGPRWFLTWLEEIEPRATVLRTWDPLLIPGLLQTEKYARAVFMGDFSSSEAEVEALVAARMRRQEVLGRGDPPELYVLMDEWVLKRPIGGPQVMAEQLAAVAAIARRRRVTVQLVPYDTACTRGLSSSFVIAELPDAPIAVTVDSAGQGETSAEHDLVSLILDRYDKLRTEAYRASESLMRIEEAAAQWTSKT